MEFKEGANCTGIKISEILEEVKANEGIGAV
jgi:hypothetical protein